MSDHDHDHDSHHDHPQGTTETLPMPPTTVVNSGTVDARVTQISEEAADELRRHVEAASGGGNRFGWFLIGFVAALAAGVVAAAIFLVVSDRDDDGEINVDVPAVELDVDP